MKNQAILDLYSDYLLSAFGPTTATGLSALLDGQISHDRIQRFLSGQQFGSIQLWQLVKPHVRAIQSETGVMVLDDSIAHKPYTDENDIICWHYDHATQQQVKGINFLTCLYCVEQVALPVGIRIVAKTQNYVDPKDGKSKRRSPISKNEHYQSLLRQAVRNQIPFATVMNDVWYASLENMQFIRHELDKHFIMPIKANRKVALSHADQQAGRFVRVDSLPLEAGVPVEIWLERLDFPLLLLKQVFVNEDGSVGILYLVSSATSLQGQDLTTAYRTRWKVEPYHKSLKQNVSLEKSPTQTVCTQTNHLFAALCGYIKLELLKQSTKLNHLALKTKLYVRALHSAWQTLQQFQPVRLTVPT